MARDLHLNTKRSLISKADHQRRSTPDGKGALGTRGYYERSASEFGQQEVA
jgi:hypothetical protein